jgi:flagellar biosynthesis protein FlhA
LEAEFYGAMDGASRFTQRDAVASILITAINIIAGFLIGVLQNGMEMKRAFQTYTILTIGDGLVTVIPALMISISGALIVTRTSSDDRVAVEFSKQLFGNRQPLMLAGGVLIALSMFPGLPAIPFLLLGGGLGTIGWRMRPKSDSDAQSPAPAAATPTRDSPESLLRVDQITIEVGLGLANWAAGGASSPLLQKIAGIRMQLAGSLGFLLPRVRVKDNLSLRSREYVILLKDMEVARYELLAGHDLAIATSKVDKPLEGKSTKEPAFGINAIWIPTDMTDAARNAGYTVVDGLSTLATHFSETVRRYAHELFTREASKVYCDRIAQDNPKVIEDLVPKLLPLSSVQRVLQNLLRERVSIRDGQSILESLGEAAASTKNAVLLTEYVRQSIRRTVVKPYVTPAGELTVYFLDPSLEQMVESAVQHGEQNSVLALSPQNAREFMRRIGQKAERVDVPVLIMTNASIRHLLKQLVENTLSNVVFLSHNEVPPGVRVTSLGTIQ